MSGTNLMALILHMARCTGFTSRETRNENN
jgi:hypothetical protein